MPTITIPFRITQAFPVSAAEAYAWATDYDANDIALFGRKGTRKVIRLTEDTLILDDAIVYDDGKKVKSKKLIHLYPERLTWVSTHLDGPTQHSQLTYEITPRGKNGSQLTYSGHRLESAKKATAKLVKTRTAEVEKMAGGAWKKLAEALVAERKSKSARPGPAKKRLGSRRG
jgi:hypothetical protein